MQTTDHPGPLDDLVVLDLSRVLAGPYATMLLADLGATVIKVESPQGDETRTWRPPEHDGESTYFQSVNRNKASIALDLTDPEDLDVIHQILQRADVLVENFKPGGLARFGLDVDTLHALFPQLIVASLSGFGHAGPGASMPGYDVLAGPDPAAGPRLVTSADTATPPGGVVAPVLPGPGERPESLGEGPDEPHADTSEEHRLRTFLSQQETDWLVDMLLEAGRRDPMFAARLAVQAGLSGASALDEAPLRAALVEAIAIEDFVGYREAWDYFWGIDQVLEEVEELIEAGFAASAARTALFAIELLEEFGGQLDDSGGGLMLAFERAEDIHLRASRNHEIDPDELASMLVDRAVSSDYEIFYDAPARYAEILGERGLRRYRELVEQRWRALPEGRDRFDGDRFAVGFLRERVAETAGGGQALLEVLAEDATSAYDHLRIAQLLYREERREEALDWIERGLEADGPDRRLNELAATIHREAGRVDRAGELLWENFTAQPGDLTYRELKSGTGEAFARWREQAIALLEQPRGRGADWTALVSALLWEGDIEGAWRAAHEGGCRQDLWLELARGRAREHPAEALPIFLREAERSIEGAQRPAYRHAAALLAEARPLAERTDGTAAFTSHVRQVRERNKRRPALQDEFTRAQLP